MVILHELNQLEMGGAERVVLGIIKHDKKNKHVVFSYKDGPMRKPLEEAGATIQIDSEAEVNIDCDIVHIHTGGASSHIASILKGEFLTIETVHSPVVSGVRDSFVHQRIGVTNKVSKMNRKCKTIYNGVDIDRLCKRTEWEKMHPTTVDSFDKVHEVSLRDVLGIPRDALVIGRLGRLGYDKNVEEFMIACWKFQKENPDCHILIVGDEAKTAGGYLAKIKVSCASLPLKNVHFLPAMEEVGLAYEAMDIFLYPSQTEGFGLVYAEAMACGVPLVTWKNEVTEELFTGHAILTEPTIEGLVKGLNLLKDPDIRDEFGEIGHLLIRSEFTDEIMSENYQKLYVETAQKFPHLVLRKEEIGV